MFFQAFNESVNDFERFITSYHIAKREKNILNKLKWFEKSLQYAIKSDDNGVKSAFPTIYLSISKCYEELGDFNKAKGEGRERVYVVEPTGTFENDPNLTDKKFPGNLTCSYRSQYPLRIIGEEKDWKKQTYEEISEWREKVDNNKGEIIN